MKNTLLEKYAANPANWHDHKPEYQTKCPQTHINKSTGVVRCPKCMHLGHPKFYLEKHTENGQLTFYKRAAIAHVHWMVNQDIGRNYIHGFGKHLCSPDEVIVSYRLTPVVYLPQSIREVFGYESESPIISDR